MMVSLLRLASLACHNVPYTSVTRQRTVDFGNIRRFSVHSPLTKDTGENLDYRLHFSQLSFTFFSTIIHKREILDDCVHFSTVNNNSRLSLTLSSTVVYISHILYAVPHYCLHFSIYFCPVWLAYDFIKEFNRAEDKYMIYRLNYTIIIYTIITRTNAAAFITILVFQERRLYEGGVYCKKT